MVRGLLQKGFVSQGVAFTDQMLDQFELMLNVLNEWNKKHNLTRIRDVEEQCVYHILDATAGCQYFESAKVVVDVGTGAGFPGLPLAICLPDVHFHLIDSNAKKVAYLRHVTRRLGLGNVTLYNKRVEAIDIKDVDMITARAVSEPEVLLDITAHMRMDQTRYALYVSEHVNQLVGSKMEKLNVPGADRQTYLLCYPVDAGQAE